MTPCQIEGCSMPYYARGLCQRHYYAEWCKNNPEKIEKAKKSRVEWRKDNPRKKQQENEEWRKDNPGAGAKWRDAELYNLLPGDREVLREFQNHTDPISLQPLSPHANLDHCHKTGLVRGLLNPLTNRNLVDDIQKLERSLEYLRNPPAPEALGERVYGLLGRARRKKGMRYGPDGSSTPKPRRVKGPVAL